MSYVVIIGEIGINHNGDVDIAKALADMALDCGCDYVKLQKREISWCYSTRDLNQPCQSKWGNTVRAKVEGRELRWDELHEFDRHCKMIGINWICSCFDLFSLRRLVEEFPDLKMNKVPSAMGVRRKFLEEVAAQKKRTLISTGLMTDEDMAVAARIFDKARCPFILNHCTSLYPCPPERINLSVIPAIEDKFCGYEWYNGVGYSGHETGILPSVIAAHMGATYIERHITLDRAMEGADHAASLEKRGLQRLVRDIRSLRRIHGTPDRRLMGDEKNPVKFWRDE